MIDTTVRHHRELIQTGNTMQYITQLRKWVRSNQIKALSFIILGFLLAFCSTLSLVYVDPATVSKNYGTDSRLVALFGILKQAHSLDPFQATCMSFVSGIIILCFVAVVPNREKHSLRCAVLAVLFAAFMAMGGHFSQQNVCLDNYQFFKISLVFISDAFLLYFFLVVMVCFAKKSWLNSGVNYPQAPANRFVRLLFCERPFISAFAVIVIAWLPYYLLCYPGTTDPNDVLDQLQQFNGIYSRTAAWVNFDDDSWLYVNNNNPFFSTLVTNTFINVGYMLFGSQNVGMFLLVLVQSVVLISGFAYVNKIQIDLKTPYWLRAMILVLVAFFMPLIPGYVVCITKDTLFSACVLWFVICLIKLRTNKPDHRFPILFYIVLFSSALLMCLIRNNGIYMLAFTLVVLMACHGSAFNKAKVILAVATACYVAYGSFLLPFLGVAPGSVKEMLSVPFQQTARYVSQYPQEVTDSQKAAISEILDYDNLCDFYNPSLSDGVKETFNKNATKEQIREYFAAWAEMGLAHPGTYVAATIANCYAYFYPGINTGWIWTCLNCYGANESIDITEKYVESGFDLHQSAGLRDYRLALREWFDIVGGSNLGLFSNMGFAAWVTIALCAFLIRKKDLGAILPLIPAAVLLLVCVLSPQNGNPRYALPLMVSIWPMFSYGFHALRLRCICETEFNKRDYDDE